MDNTVSPWQFPLYRTTGILTAVGATLLIFQIWQWTADPPQAFYFSTYARVSLIPDLSHLHWSIQRGLPTGTPFPVLFKGQSVVTENNFRSLPGAFSQHTVQLNWKGFKQWLRIKIYQGRSFSALLSGPLYLSETMLAVFFLLGYYLDRKRLANSRNGLLLRGPGLMSRWAFNRKTKGDGLAFRLSNRRNLWELFMPGDSGKYLRIRRDREAHHIQIAGDTGSGKSTLIRSILYEIEARGNETVIIFDPHREYIQEFFREDRGDWVLNPKDDRCPYWPIGEEVTDEADATPVANGFFPEAPSTQRFFLQHTRAIFAYLLARYKPSVNELAYWMAHPEEIDKRVKGTEHEHTLTANAAPQRAGVLGSLNEAGKPLRMMPTQQEGRRVWTAKQWAKERRGWIFITSTAETIDALRPIQSLWLDMLILKLQTSAPQPNQARVWMVLDELASLNQLPQLQSALTGQRKSDNPIVIGFQGMSQLDALYGKSAETILSQAFTNFVLRTREPRGSKHMSDLLGKAQLERLRESKPARLLQWQQGTYSTERVIDPVVMDSEIQSLDDLSGFFVQKDSIVSIRFAYTERRTIAPALIERIIPATELRPLDPENPQRPMAASQSSPKGSNTKRPKKAKESVLPSSAPAQEMDQLFT